MNGLDVREPTAEQVAQKEKDQEFSLRLLLLFAGLVFGSMLGFQCSEQHKETVEKNATTQRLEDAGCKYFKYYDDAPHGWRMVGGNVRDYYCPLEVDWFKLVYGRNGR